MRIRLNNTGFAIDTNAWLFRHLDYEFHSGSFVAITGPSGSGKSTLLNLIGGLLKPSEGTIERGGSVANEKPFSWVMQSNPVLSGRTVVENVAIGFLADGSPWNESKNKAYAILEKFGLDQIAERSIGNASGGEIQRTVVARCLASSSPTILADEPTGQLDLGNSQLVIEALTLAADSGKTVIVVTHDYNIASAATASLDLRNR